MGFKPQINYNSKLPAEDSLKAIVNWVNFLLREMTVGRVTDKAERSEVQAVQDETDALLVDQEYRLTLLELGLIE